MGADESPGEHSTDAITHAHAGGIVLGVDGSKSAGHALDWAVDQAVAERRALTLAHAIPRSVRSGGVQRFSTTT